VTGLDAILLGVAFFIVNFPGKAHGRMALRTCSIRSFTI
jgi:hypothetical protein